MLISLWTMAAVSLVTGVLGALLAWLEDQRGVESAVGFDLVRAISITAFGWGVVALSTVLDPIRMGAAIYVPPTVMATATFLCFLIQVIGWLCFVVFRWQSLHGRHPWQRSGRRAT